MADEKINVKIVSAYDDKAADEAIKDAEKIEQLDPELAITADDKATPEIKDVTDEAKTLTKEDWVVTLKANIAAAKGEIEELQTKLKALDEPVDVKVNMDTTSAEEGLRRTGEAADDSRGRISELVGESVAELPGIGEALGPAGEALSGLTESALAGEISIGNLIGAAGGMAIATVGFQLATQAISSIGAEAREVEANTKALTEALKTALGVRELLLASTTDQTSASDALNVALSENEEEFEKGVRALSKLGRTSDQYADTLIDLAGDTDTARDTMRDLLKQYGLTGAGVDDLIDKVNASEDPFWGVSEANTALASSLGITTDELSSVGKSMEELQDQSERQDLAKSAEDVLLLAAAATTAEGEIARTILTAEKFKGDPIAALDEYQRKVADVREEQEDTTTATEDFGDDAPRYISKATVEARNLLTALNNVKTAVEEAGDENAYLDVKDGFDKVKLAAEEAWVAASEGAVDAEQKSRDYQRAINDQKILVHDYLTEVLGLPESVVTTIIAEMDGSMDEAETRVDNLTKPKTIPINVKLIGIAPGGRKIPIEDLLAGATSASPTPPVVTPMSAAPMNVTINMPRGSRGVDVVRQIAGQARRSGRRYGVPVVHYARAVRDKPGQGPK